jgi:hypothetical protein
MHASWTPPYAIASTVPLLTVKLYNVAIVSPSVRKLGGPRSSAVPVPLRIHSLAFCTREGSADTPCENCAGRPRG